MNNFSLSESERFKHERDAFRIWISGKGEKELVLLMDDIKLRQDYLENIKPENIIKNLEKGE